MYDPWGIGEALRMSMRMYSHAKRATGRTTLLLSALRDGDTVVTAMRAEGQRLQQEARDRGIKIKTISYDPRETLDRQYDQIMFSWDRKGQLYFDHMWFEAFYFYQIEALMGEIEKFTKSLSARAPDPQRDKDEHLQRMARAIGGDWEGD